MLVNMRSLCVALLITIFSSSCNFGNAEETIDASLRIDLAEVMQVNKSYGGGKLDNKHEKGRIPKGTKIRKIILQQDVDRETLAYLWEHSVQRENQRDMILSVDEELALVNLEENQGRIHKRKAVKNTRLLWPQAVIPFTIDEKIEKTRNATGILAAMRYIESVSCLKFVPNNSTISKNLGHNSYVYISLGDSCYSTVGMFGHGRQPLVLSNACLKSQRSIVHELLHTAGFSHEHSRPDRDKYVQINWFNILESEAVNFVKKDLNTDYPYDLHSIMHYDMNSFAIDNRFPTIKVVNPLLQYDIVYPGSMTYSDIHMLNDVYSCSAGCPETDCGSGFLGAGCECFCSKADENEPDDYCNEKPAEILRGCRYNLTATSGTITSPNFPSPYGNNTKCLWYIHAEEGKIITLTFHTFSIESSPECESDFLQVRDKDVYEYTENLCGHRIPGKFTSDRNEMLLYFKTDEYIHSMGFNATYVITDDSHLDYSNCWMKSCYINLNQEALWKEAKAMCVQEGGHLPVINNKDENEFIRRYIARLNIGLASWIGYRSAGRGKEWNWVIDEPTANFTSWHSTEPISSRKARCAAAVVYGFWVTEPCASKYYPVICEIPSKTTEAILYDWGTWTSCTVSCGGGTRRRHRQCSQPGLCSEKLRESEPCGKVPCPNRIIKSHNATMSSTLEIHHAMKAIDGHPWPRLWFGSCSRTELEWEPWWMVDLGEFYVVEKIIITKMSDFGGKHLIGAVVRVGNVAVAGRNMKCGPTISKTMVLLDYHIDIECSPAIVGRYVSIQTEKIGRRLSLCEVEVYTTVLEFPVIECPPRVSGIARGGASNAEVSWYSPILIDPFDRTFNVVCIPEMNSKFQLGSSNVTCVATAEDGTTLSCGFPVTVKATEFPVITCPTSLSAFAREGALTTEVGGWRLTVNDPFDRTFDVVCIPAPSSEFQLGSTNVTCVATARDGTAFSCGFPVTVKGLTCPSRAFAFTREGASTAEVSWDSPTVNDPFRAFDVACKPEKNSKFQLGSSNVTCIATAENSPTLSCGFSVTVKTCDNRLESNCYIFSKEKKSYYESRTACREIGADLVVIESLEENVYITSKMDFEFPKGTKAAFIGMNDVDAKGVWVWVNGDHVNSFTNWKNEKPDLNKHDCGTIQNGGKWDNAFCTSEMYFICEAKLKPLSLTCPNDIKLPIKRGTSGKTITYSAPLLNDADRFHRPPTITCSYPSGKFFPLGKTDVKCSAVLDQQKLASCSFRVKLRELEPLSLTCPNDIKLPIKRGTSGKTITYSAPLLNDADRFHRPPTITCSYPSGKFFPLGKTDVKCSAVLDQQKLASCSFRVKLRECEDEFLESCYIYVSEKRSFKEQVSICQEAGGSLVDIHSQEENDFLTKKFLGPRKYVYAGLRYRTNSGWKWENGQGIEDFKNWASSEPKEYTNGKSCLALKPSGKWKDYKCTTKHRTICELDIGG